MLVEGSVFTVSVEVVVVGFGVKITVEPDGCPIRLSVTAPLKPFEGVTDTVKEAVLPRLTDCVIGFTESEKSGVPWVIVTAAVPLTVPLVAVTVNGPPAVLPAVKRPFPLPMTPPPLTDQLLVGCGLIGWPN